jgi:hypothetical protein
VIVELLVSAALLLGPPVSLGPPEGPAGPDDELDEPADQPDEEPELDASAPIVEAAAIAALDRAVLERNNREVGEFVRHLDALASVEGRLDTCGRALQAELRMSLALAYLRRSGACDDSDDHSEEPTNLEYPSECDDARSASECAALLLERAAEFGDTGPAGAEDPLAQAAGCPHAADSMSVEHMYGSCVANEYAAAVERWRAGVVEDEPVEIVERRTLDVPRWASIAGISVGAAAIAGGAVLLAIDGRCPGGHDPMVDIEECPNVYNTNVGGTVLISVGALAVLSMATILTITEIQRKRSNGGQARVMRRRMARVEALTGWRAPGRRLQVGR